ncbi:MAG TPA: radical SAM protein [Candidatus Paenibacillus intestinavium]|nr:radical SAM protein [Candidatus Paenibacillus intestinavium]
MHIHSFTPSTFVNGPGNRAMIHFQGCTLACPGCFNTATHPKEAGEEVTVNELIDRIPATADGITISGGEPFMQPEDLYHLVTELRSKFDSIVVFSGFYLHEIKNIRNGNDIINMIDVLIDGRFEKDKLADNGLRGSDNQTIHLLSDRHTYDDFAQRNVEITINNIGELSMTGFPSQELITGIAGLGGSN